MPQSSIPTQNITTPVPDPTELTVDMLRRELGGLKELITTRVNAVEKASETFQDNLQRVPTEVQKQVQHLQELTDQKFAAVEQRFVEQKMASEAALAAVKDRFETDVATYRTAVIAQNQERMNYVNAALESVRARIEAAMLSQREATAAQNTSNVAAVMKSEAATTKQIDGIYAQLKETKDVMNDKIEAINSRLNRGEGAERAKSSDQARLLAIGALLIAAMGVGMAYLNSQHLSIARSGFSAPAVTVEPKTRVP